MQYSWRFYALLGLLLLSALGLVGRMITLSVFERSFLMEQSKSRTLRLIDIPAYRGMMTDRNGIPLAISAPVDSMWVNPQTFEATDTQLTALANSLHLSVKEIKHKTAKNSGREFVYLARNLSPETAEHVKELKIQGIYSQRGYRRFYPSGDATAHVLGFTNVDDKGQEGLELAYDDWLRGIPGKRQVVKDRLGQVVSDLGVVHPPQEGRDLPLSIDARLQYLAYTALEEAVPKYHATSASIVVLDVKTGEILTMANVPSYNPNTRLPNNANRYRNRAATDLFEPGSTMKAFSVANALASGKYKPTTLIDTRPGWINIHGHIIKDHDNYGIITLTQILQKSSNIGAIKITLPLPPESLWDLLTKMGFGQRTGSGFPGEAAGLLVKSRFKKPTELATMSYGYGISVTPLQLTRAYAILAAHGIKQPVTFLKTDEVPSGKRVMKAELADQMLILLKAVAEGGSGIKAQVPGYHVGGKTGTAYTARHGGYETNRYNSSFIGIAPLSDPRLVVTVILNGVQGNIHFGAQVSAPIFSIVMREALRYMNVPPDNL